jgi:hypothetical protein
MFASSKERTRFRSLSQERARFRVILRRQGRKEDSDRRSLNPLKADIKGFRMNKLLIFFNNLAESCRVTLHGLLNQSFFRRFGPHELFLSAEIDAEAFKMLPPNSFYSVIIASIPAGKFEFKIA